MTPENQPIYDLQGVLDAVAAAIDGFEGNVAVVDVVQALVISAGALAHAAGCTEEDFVAGCRATFQRMLAPKKGAA